MKEIFELNWGTITPEFYNGQKNSVVHIFNHVFWARTISIDQLNLLLAGLNGIVPIFRRDVAMKWFLMTEDRISMMV